MNKGIQFFIDEDDHYGPCLALCGEWSSGLASVIEKEGVRSLRLSFSNGWKGDNIVFLNEVPSSVTGFEIYSWKVADLSPLIDRKGVERLAFQVELKRVFDFGFLPILKTLKFVHSAKTKNLQGCHRLEHLNVMGYPDEDFGLLAAMQSLERLQVSSRKLRCLDGIPNLKKLRIIDFAECPNLVNLAGIEQVKTLEEIEIADCNAIKSLPCLSSLERLKSLIVENCGTLKSISFLNAHKALERVLIIGNTQIADGDLTPLKTLPNLCDVRVAEGDYNLEPDEVSALRR
jgi:hypothetical protein